MPRLNAFNNGTTGMLSQFGSTASARNSLFTVASGGSLISDISVSGLRYRVHTFTSSGTMSWPTISLYYNTTINLDILIVAGGGGGGSAGSYGGGGGGGAGGLVYVSSYAVNLRTNRNYSIVVGNGGNGDQGGYLNGDAPITLAQNGQNSTAFGYTALGGGAGGDAAASNAIGSAGGSSGGTGGDDNTFPPAALQPTSGSGGFGNIGGRGNSGGNAQQAGGGGGAGGVGGYVDHPTLGSGPGGAGLSYDITGTSVDYAGGGGGGKSNSTIGSAGSGGSGGGGAGGGNRSNGNDATFYGGGGGGAGWNYPNPALVGGNGYKGVVIVRYRIA